MLYEYTKTQLPHLQYIHDEVAASAMTDKGIEWCNWEEDDQELKVNFTNTLSTEDEDILDSIVAACPNETFDAPEELRIKNGDKHIGFKSPEVLAEDTIYVLPEDGATGQAMVTNGDKNLSFETIPTHSQNTDVALRTDKLIVDASGNAVIVGELKIKVYAQDAEPTLSADEFMAIWKDTDDSNRIYLVFRRAESDQVLVELA